MAERKVLTKYYPPDFDPAALTRRKRPKNTAPKLQPVRLMAPFSMRCLKCNDYVYKGRKFNARKETLEERYYSIPIYRFYICCPSCSSEICFKTDPKNMDYECERGASRNFEAWREAKLAEETEEERLDRLEREEADKDVMAEMEKKQLDAKTEMAIADALDEIRSRNARNERSGKGLEVAVGVVRKDKSATKEKEDAEDAEAARRAFSIRYLDDMGVEEYDEEDADVPLLDSWVSAERSTSETQDTKKKSPSISPPAESDSIVVHKVDQQGLSMTKTQSPLVQNSSSALIPDFTKKAKPKTKTKSLIKGLKAKPNPKDPLGLGY